MNKLFLKYKVEPCERIEIRDFIEKWHYSKNINGVISNHCFKMTEDGKIIGACIFGKPAMAGQWKPYAEKSDDITELRRLVCIHDTEKNAESYFIGRCLKWLKANTEYKSILSYADPEYGHQGVIYKASNFKLMGQSSKGRVIMYKNKKYHDKVIRTFNNGILKPFGQEIKKALENGEAIYKNTCGKNIYLYNLRVR